MVYVHGYYATFYILYSCSKLNISIYLYCLNLNRSLDLFLTRLDHESSPQYKCCIRVYQNGHIFCLMSRTSDVLILDTMILWDMPTLESTHCCLPQARNTTSLFSNTNMPLKHSTRIRQDLPHLCWALKLISNSII